MLGDLDPHLVDAFWDIPKTTIGFFLALALNRLVGVIQDRNSFRSMVRAIRSEACANDAILRDSFLKLYRQGIVLRELDTTTASHFLAMPEFLDHAEPALVESLQRYVRDLKLANAYRARSEKLRVEKPNSEWLVPLIEAWGSNLRDCDSDIKSVSRLT